MNSFDNKAIKFVLVGTFVALIGLVTALAVLAGGFDKLLATVEATWRYSMNGYMEELKRDQAINPQREPLDTRSKP